jgi:hypothetical protein
MALPSNENDTKLYGKLYVSCMDINFARYCAGVLIKKGWHWQPWERRGTIYQQQAAFTSSLVISYIRPFTKSRGWSHPVSQLAVHGQHKKAAIYNTEEQILHTRLRKMRNQIYAHSDSTSYSINPHSCGDFITDIVAAPTMLITAKEAIMFQEMTTKLLFSISENMNVLRTAITKV